MLVKIYGGAVLGVEAAIIAVEVNVDRGIGYHLVGLPDNAIKESHYRIAAALLNNGFKIPGKKITINMAPADMRKEGASYDLTLAIGILIASEQIKAADIEHYFIMGELSLDGQVNCIKGVLPMAIKAKNEGFNTIIVPLANAREAAIVQGIEVLGIQNIGEVIRYFIDGEPILPTTIDIKSTFYDHLQHPEFDFAEVRGQESIKRCMEIAAAGGHNIILIGPPGAGKTMLAKRLPSILPPLTLEEALETTKIHSVVGNTGEKGLLCSRPFRNPHHTISDVALVGGGTYPQPGEISLSHNGVLFLDELPEFKRSVLEVMRQPLEDREVTISRARFTVTYPCSFMLVASMNPSPTGYFNNPESALHCSPAEMQRYLGRISGPLLDRIDIHIEVTPVPFEELSQGSAGEGSSAIRDRVTAARRIQTHRFQSNTLVHYNAQMGVREIRNYCVLNKGSKELLKNAMEKLGLSARAYDRILKVARSIADLAGTEAIETAHIAEAIQYRSLDREGWLG